MTTAPDFEKGFEPIPASELTFPSFEYVAHNNRILVVGEEAAPFARRLEKLSYQVIYDEDPEDALDSMRATVEETGSGSKGFQLAYLHSKVVKPVFVSKLREIDDTLSIVVVTSTCGEVVDSSFRGHIIDSIEVDMPTELINNRTEALLKNKLMKLHLKRLLARRQELLQAADEVYARLENQDAMFEKQAERVEKLELELAEQLKKNSDIQVELSTISEERKVKEKRYEELTGKLQTLVNSCNTLNQDPRNSKALAKLLSEKDNELMEIKKKVSEAFESPIQRLMRNVTSLTKMDVDTVDRTELRKTLIDLLKALGSNELYRPAFKKLFDAVELDSMTKNWMQDQFCSEEETDISANTVSDKPAKEEDKPAKEEDPSVGLAVDEASSTPTPSPTETPTETPTTSRPPSSFGPAIEQPSLALESEYQIVTEEDYKLMSTFDVVVWDYTRSQHFRLIEFMLDDLGFLDSFQVPRGALYKFLSSISSQYQNNFYHNWNHAFDVTQTLYAVLKSTKVSSFLNELDMFALLVAGACHDVDHPGVNNQFQINTQTDHALTYNDRSVLENHHCYCTFLVLQNPESNIIANLSPTQSKYFRRVFIAAVLATDMSSHFELTSKFSTHVDTTPFEKEDPKDRELLMQILLHSADVSNPCKPWDVCLRFSKGVFDEFLSQGDQEKKLNIPVSPYMDRNDTDQMKLNVNFINFMVRPLFNAIGNLLTELQESLLLYMKYNEDTWKARKEARDTGVESTTLPSITGSSSSPQSSKPGSHHTSPHVSPRPLKASEPKRSSLPSIHKTESKTRLPDSSHLRRR